MIGGTITFGQGTFAVFRDAHLALETKILWTRIYQFITMARFALARSQVARGSPKTMIQPPRISPVSMIITQDRVSAKRYTVSPLEYAVAYFFAQSVTKR
jgi:hypothetical protein